MTMQILTAQISLMASPTRTISDLPSVDFYRSYFLDICTGVAGYWYTQTNNQLLIEGDVQPWQPFAIEPNYDSRSWIVGQVVNQGLSVYPHSMYIIVVASPLSLTEPGKQIGIAAGGYGPFAVISVGDPFDFVAHEVGHLLG
jgi:hypothetical protein